MIISNGGVLTKQSERRRRKMSESETVWFYDVWLAIQVCSRLKHVFNIRGSSFNSFLINSLFTACRRSEVIIMRRVVRERSRIVHCTRFDGFRFFFAMNFMTKYDARQAFQSTRLIVSFSTFSSFSPLTKHEKQQFWLKFRYAMCN